MPIELPIVLPIELPIVLPIVLPIGPLTYWPIVRASENVEAAACASVEVEHMSGTGWEHTIGNYMENGLLKSDILIK